jgi:hypothetical protein
MPTEFQDGLATFQCSIHIALPLPLQRFRTQKVGKPTKMSEGRLQSTSGEKICRVNHTPMRVCEGLTEGF